MDGNLQDISSAGSLHEFLVDLHDKFGPVASFWFGQEFCISVSNPFTFKEIQSLFDRPSKFVLTMQNKLCTYFIEINEISQIFFRIVF